MKDFKILMNARFMRSKRTRGRVFSPRRKPNERALYIGQISNGCEHRREIVNVRGVSFRVTFDISKNIRLDESHRSLIFRRTHVLHSTYRPRHTCCRSGLGYNGFGITTANESAGFSKTFRVDAVPKSRRCRLDENTT